MHRSERASGHENRGAARHVVCFGLASADGMVVRARSVVDDLRAIGAAVTIIAVGDDARVRIDGAARDVRTVSLPGGRWAILWHLSRALRSASPSLDALVIESAMFGPRSGWRGPGSRWRGT